MTTLHRQRMIDQGLSKPRHADEPKQTKLAKQIAADEQAEAEAREKHAADRAKHAADAEAEKRKRHVARHEIERALRYNEGRKKKA